MKSFQERANELIHQGDRARSHGRIEEAIRSYREAIDLVPGYLSLQLVIGDLRFEQEAFEEAAAAYEQVADFDPDNDQAWVGLGRCRLMLEEYQSAAEAIEAALEVRADHAEANYYGAILSARAGDDDTAVARLHIALTRRPAWEGQAREEPLLSPLFERSHKLRRLGQEKRWWEIWR